MGVYENLMDVFGRLRAIPGSFNFAWIIIEIYEKKNSQIHYTHYNHTWRQSETFFAVFLFDF